MPNTDRIVIENRLTNLEAQGKMILTRLDTIANKVDKLNDVQAHLSAAGVTPFNTDRVRYIVTFFTFLISKTSLTLTTLAVGIYWKFYT